LKTAESQQIPENLLEYWELNRKLKPNAR